MFKSSSLLCSLAVVVAMTAVAHASPLSDAYSDQQKSAAVSVDLARRNINKIGERCLSSNISNETMRFILYLNKMDNMDVTLPADKILAAIPPSQRQQLEQLLGGGEATDNGNSCGSSLYQRLHDKAHNTYADVDINAAKTLRAVFAVNSAMRIDKRDQDLTTGCIKQRYNIGVREFDITLAQCECMTRAIKRNATDPEIDSWLASLGKSPPWWDKVTAEVTQCH